VYVEGALTSNRALLGIQGPCWLLPCAGLLMPTTAPFSVHTLGFMSFMWREKGAGRRGQSCKKPTAGWMKTTFGSGCDFLMQASLRNFLSP